MDKLTLWEKIKEIIAGIAWRVFLWASALTQDEYLDQVYKQEKAYKESEGVTDDNKSPWDEPPTEPLLTPY